MWSWFDYNLENALTTNKLSGAILIDNIGNNTSYTISNCEIFGFSYAGIFISKKTKAITIEKCYIHNIKGICTSREQVMESRFSLKGFGIRTILPI